MGGWGGFLWLTRLLFHPSPLSQGRTRVPRAEAQAASGVPLSVPEAGAPNSMGLHPKTLQGCAACDPSHTPLPGPAPLPGTPRCSVHEEYRSAHLWGALKPPPHTHSCLNGGPSPAAHQSPTGWARNGGPWAQAGSPRRPGQSWAPRPSQRAAVCTYRTRKPSATPAPVAQ